MQSSKQEGSNGRAERHAKSPHAEGTRMKSAVAAFLCEDLLALAAIAKGAARLWLVRTCATNRINHAVVKSAKPKVDELSGACIQGKPGGCGFAVGDAPTSQPPNGWVGASDRQPNLDLAMRLQFRVSMVLRKGNLSCSAMLPSPLRASETNSSTILHSVINIGRDPNQFFVENNHQPWATRWLPHIPISCPGRSRCAQVLLCLC